MSDASVERSIDAAPPIDSAPPSDAAPPLVDHGYVVSQVNMIPTTTAGHTYTDYGLDLGTPTSSELDGKVDNQIGQALSALSGLISLQGESTSVFTGTTIQLLDLKSANFVNGPAEMALRFGTHPTPPACSNPVVIDSCGRHLSGNASFDLATLQPNDAPIVGEIVNGTFSTTTAGTLTIELALGDATTPFVLHMVHARIKASGPSTEGINTANLGGIVTETEVTNNFLPQFQKSFNGVLAAAGCRPDGDPRATPACGCTAPTTTTSLILSQIDGDLSGSTKDCKISIDEIRGYEVFQVLFKHDACSQDLCVTPDAYSFGIQIQAVKAIFPLN